MEYFFYNNSRKTGTYKIMAIYRSDVKYRTGKTAIILKNHRIIRVKY